VILQTRYRDIPFEQIEQDHAGATRMPYETAEYWNTRLRGKPVTIQIPGNPPEADHCREPVYWIVKGPVGHLSAVCSHLAEIGD
jgi:hypothetical protein